MKAPERIQTWKVLGVARTVVVQRLKGALVIALTMESITALPQIEEDDTGAVRLTRTRPGGAQMTRTKSAGDLTPVRWKIEALETSGDGGVALSGVPLTAVTAWLQTSLTQVVGAA